MFLVPEEHELEQQLLLGLEVGVERAGLDARRLRNLPYRDPVVAALRETYEGLLEQPTMGSV